MVPGLEQFGLMAECSILLLTMVFLADFSVVSHV